MQYNDINTTELVVAPTERVQRALEYFLHKDGTGAFYCEIKLPEVNVSEQNN